MSYNLHMASTILLIGWAGTSALFGGCGTVPLKGVTPDGQKVYLATTNIRSTPMYETYEASGREPADKLVYLMARIRDSENLLFYHDKGWYSPQEAYRGSMWVLRKEFQKGQDARSFVKQHVARQKGGEPHLVKYPDGTIQSGYHLLLNELELLEQTSGEAPPPAVA